MDPSDADQSIFTHIKALDWTLMSSYQLIQINKTGLFVAIDSHPNTNILDLWRPPGVDVGATVIQFTVNTPTLKNHQGQPDQLPLLQYTHGPLQDGAPSPDHYGPLKLSVISIECSTSSNQFSTSEQKKR